MAEGQQKSQNSRETWLEYERRKKGLSRDLTPVEYDMAVKRIAKELGI